MASWSPLFERQRLRVSQTQRHRHGYIEHGAHVFCPVEDPTGAYAKRRAQGVNAVLASFGARCDVVGVGFADAGNQSMMIRYLQRHPDPI
jgi:hypothetical protein